MINRLTSLNTIYQNFGQNSVQKTSQSNMSFKAQPKEDEFIHSNLTPEQKEKYLEAKTEHTEKGKESSYFTKVFNNEVPGKAPILVVKRDDKVSVGVILDGYPVNRGHALIVPKRPIASLFQTTPEERQDLFTALEEYKKLLETKLEEKGLPKPVAYNIGINDGFAAGQTVPHLHVQVIPRYFGDVPNPRGGVRGVKGVEENTLFEDKQWGKQKYQGPPDKSVDDLFSKQTKEIKVT